MRSSVVDNVSTEFFSGELHSVQPILKELENSIHFEHFSYILRTSTPVSCPRVAVFCTYPNSWVRKYQENNFAACDPVLRYSGAPSECLLWNEKTFSGAQELWEEARGYGINTGATTVFRQPNGVNSVLSVVRSAEPICTAEMRTMSQALVVLESRLRKGLCRSLAKHRHFFPDTELSGRETDILKYTADGWTAEEIAPALYIASSTVNFHIKNAIAKLEAKNKTEAAIKATLWGLL